MATAAFKSTTKRSSIGGADDTTSSSSGNRRRTRSVSRFSHRLPSELLDFETKTPLPSTRRKFVNTVRGAGFAEISLDDLAIQLFSSAERGRSSEIYSPEASKAQRRGRSMSRRRASDLENSQCEKFTRNGNAKDSNLGNKQKGTLHMQASLNQNRGLRRCSSQTDFLKLQDSCSSQSYSSTLTDDEACDACYGSDDYENLKANNTSNKLHLSIRSGVNNDQLELLQEKHKNIIEKQNQGNKESQRISRRLKGDAEKIIEDFISSVEDNTDISSFDGERSDTSSTFGVSVRPKEAKNYTNTPRTASIPIEMDGVIFPWLTWETSNDDISQSIDQKQIPTFSKTCLQDAHKGIHKSQLLKNVPKRSRVAVVDLDDYLVPQSEEDRLLDRWKLRSMIKSGGIIICEGPILL